MKSVRLGEMPQLSQQTSFYMLLAVRVALIRSKATICISNSWHALLFFLTLLVFTLCFMSSTS